MPEITDPRLIAEFNSAPARQAPRYETIRGRVDPYKVEDQSLQRDAARRSEEDQRMQRDRDVLTREKDQLEIRKKTKELSDGDIATAVGEERKAGAFLIRALGANDSYEGLNIGPRSLVGQGLADGAPGLLNSLPGFIGNSPNRQIADTNQDEFIAASLRQDSGAAIPEQELERQRRIYFPMPGDGPDVIEAKKAARARAIEGLKQSSGKLLDESLARYGEMRKPNVDEFVNRGAKQEIQLASPSDIIASATGTAKFTKEQVAATSAYLDTKPTAQEFQDFISRLSRGKLQNQSLESAQETINQHNKGNRFSGFSYPDTEQDTAPTPKMLEEADTVSGGIGAAGRGAIDTISLGAGDEIAAGINTLSGGTYQDNLNAERRVKNADESVNPLLRLGGQVAGGFALPVSGAGGAIGAASQAAGYGALYGFNSGEGGFGDRVEQGIVGAAFGGGITRGLQRAGAALANRPSAIASRNIQEAADRQGVELMAGDTGGTLQSLMAAGMAQSPVASGTIVKAANRVNNQIGARLDELANSQGAPVQKEVFGDTIRNASNEFAKRSGSAAKREYDAAKAIDANQTFTANTARKTLNDNLAELGETPSTSGDVIKGLRDILRDIPVGKNLSIDAIRRLRTNVRSMAQSDKLSVTDFERRAMLVMDDLSTDMAGQMSPAKAAAFLKADQNYAERMDMLKNVIPEILGPSGKRSSEMVAKRLVNMSRSDSARATKFIESLEPSEQGIVRGSIIKEMGRASPTNQTPDGDAFSFVEFNKVFNDMPERSKQMIFPGNTRNIANDLALIANGAKSSRRFANTSNTAGAINAGALIGKAVSGGAAFKSLGATIPAELLTAQLLSHPRIIRSLANLVRINTSERRAAALSALQGMAARVPGLKVDEISNYIKGQK